eukprot:765726-Hanusia_phi.AAC.2
MEQTQTSMPRNAMTVPFVGRRHDGCKVHGKLDVFLRCSGPWHDVGGQFLVERAMAEGTLEVNQEV